MHIKKIDLIKIGKLMRAEQIENMDEILYTLSKDEALRLTNLISAIRDSLNYEYIRYSGFYHVYDNDILTK